MPLALVLAISLGQAPLQAEMRTCFAGESAEAWAGRSRGQPEGARDGRVTQLPGNLAQHDVAAQAAVGHLVPLGDLETEVLSAALEQKAEVPAGASRPE